MSTMPDLAGEVIVGVDTHEREHVAALVDELGRLRLPGLSIDSRRMARSGRRYFPTVAPPQTPSASC